MGSKRWWLAFAGFGVAGGAIGLSPSAGWPDHIEIFFALACCAAGIAFGAKAVWLPIVASCSFGAVWLIRMGPSTNPATGDNQGAIVLLVILVACVLFGAVALAGATLRWLLRRPRRGSSSS
jgi:hypothetical protein